MSKVKGNLLYKEEKKKKAKKRNSDKKDKKREEKYRRQSKCNHVAKNTNKSYFKKVYDDAGNYIGRKCLICGEIILDDPNLVSVKAIKDAGKQIISVTGQVRRKYNVGPTLDENFTTMIYMIKKLPRLIKELDKKKKKNKKSNYNKNKRNKKNKKMKRRSY